MDTLFLLHDYNLDRDLLHRSIADDPVGIKGVCVFVAVNPGRRQNVGAVPISLSEIWPLLWVEKDPANNVLHTIYPARS